MRVGIQTKATITATLLVAVLAFLMMSISVYHGKHALRAELNKQGEVTVTGLARNATYPMMVRDTLALGGLVRGALSEREVMSVRFVDREGRSVIAVDRAPLMGLNFDADSTGRPVTDDLQEVKRRSSYLGDLEIIHFIIPIAIEKAGAGDEEAEMALLGLNEPAGPDQRRVLGYAEIALTTRYLEAAVRVMRNNMMAATVFAALLSILIVLVPVRLFLHPIRELAVATTKVAEGDYDHHVETKRSDELGDLASAFNRMTDNLKKSREALVEKKLLEDLVAELKATQQQLIQAGKMAAIGQLAAGIAHEINNPLAGIMGYSELVVDKLSKKVRDGIPPVEVPGFQKYLGNIVRQTNRCKEIVQNLLKFARSSNREEVGPVNLREVVRETADLLEHQLSINNVSLELDIAESLPLIKGHAGKLQQVFTNLIINGMQACEGREGTITINAGYDGDMVQVKVSDTGKGIHPELLDKIFEPFFTTKKVGQGTGLGLSVSYGLVKGMGGDIRVESIPAEGTIFELSFKPVSRDEADEATDPEQTVQFDTRSSREVVASM